MHQPPTISTIIITKDEAHNIRECLESVSWTDEIIVLDSGSTDGTVAIAREFTDKVFETDWPGFGPQKNRALNKATGDWVLSIDADERVTPELKAEIENVIDSSSCSAFEIPRCSSYCGKFLKHGGWWPDYVLRLAVREKARFSDSPVHERILIEGAVGRLKNPLVHYTYRSPDDVTSMIHRYSSAAAEQMFGAGRRSSYLEALTRSLWAFGRTYILRAGFLDGREGFMLAVSNAEYTYYKYVKLFYLNRSRNDN